MAVLPIEEINRRLETLGGWRLVTEGICKRFTFTGFPEAVAFVNRIVPVAETADHHPDIAIHYKHVTLTYSTHSEGGVTTKDFSGARAVERLFRPDAAEEDV